MPTHNRHLYGPDHWAERKAWTPHVQLGTVHCWRCGQTIDPTQHWDLGHRDQPLPRHPEHTRCNRSAGAIDGNRQRHPHSEPW